MCAGMDLAQRGGQHIGMNPIHDPAFDLNLLKVFDALMQARSVSRAAGLLGVTQSAVSHALARLRVLAGDPLFVRGAGGMQPTPRAGRLAEPLRDALLAAARALAREDAFDPLQEARVFTVAASDSLQTVLLGRVLAGLAAPGMRPALRLRSLDAEAALQALDAGEIDAAVGYLPRLRRWHRRQVLFSESHACLFNPALLPLPVPVSLQDFAACAHVVPSLRGELSSFVDEALERHGLRRRVVGATAQFLLLPMLLTQAPLMATLPSRLAAFCAGVAWLATSPLPVPVASYDVTLAWHSRDAASPALQWLLARIAEAANAPPAASAAA